MAAAATFNLLESCAGPAGGACPQASEAEMGVRDYALEGIETLGTNVSRVLEILHALQALFAVKPDVRRADFHRFVRSALHRMPELQALEWIPRVIRGQRAAFEAAARADGVVGFHFSEIGPEGLRPAGEREEYWPVYYAEPQAANRAVLGLDLGAHASRRLALDQAARSGEPTATAPLRLAQSADGRLGYLVVLPVPRPEGGVLGFCLAAFRVERLVDEVFSGLDGRGLRLEIEDVLDEARVIYRAGEASRVEPGWSFEHDVRLAGRVLRLRFEPTARFSVTDPEWLRRAAASLRHTNAVLEARVVERTAQLAELNQALKREVAEREAAARALRERTDELERTNLQLRDEIERRRTMEAALRQADEQLDQISSAEMDRWALAGFGGRSAAMQRVVQAVRRLSALTHTNIVITGERGTGKEVVARAIHYGGPLARMPFVVVSCAGMSSEHWQSLVSAPSAPAGGPGSRRGTLAAAKGGTLFLDGVEELPPKFQTRLYRWLIDDAPDRPARVVAASSADLAAAISAGDFRADLYYVLLGCQITVAPLRERLEDLPMLATLLLRQLAAELKRPVPKLLPETIDRLVAYSYPGNVRELRNTLERALLLGTGGTLRADDLVFAQSSSTCPVPAGMSGSIPFNLKQAEAVLIKRALAASNGNVSAAARLLGVNRARIYRVMKQ